MPELKNKSHERFCWLLAEGKSREEAYLIINPDNKAPKQCAYQYWNSNGVKERFAEIKEEIQTRSVLKICRKRELLRQMAEGTTPTKVIKASDGKITATYDRHLALVTDAKLAREFQNEEDNEHKGPILRLEFNMVGRNTAPNEALEAEWERINPETVKLLNEQEDLTRFEQAKIKPDRTPSLDSLKEIIDDMEFAN